MIMLNLHDTHSIITSCTLILLTLCTYEESCFLSEDVTEWTPETQKHAFFLLQNYWAQESEQIEQMI